MRNLARLAEASFERLGDRESLFFEGQTYRSGDLFERSRRLAGGLIELGVKPGDRVVVSMANSPDVGTTYSALWRAGAAITPAMFLLTQAEVRHILEHSEAVGVVTSPELLAHVKGAAEGVESVRWIASSGPVEDGVVAFDELAQSEPASIVDVDDAAMAALMYTGGTTGRAKGVVLSHENLWYCGHSAWESGYEPDINRTLIPLPLAHSYGLIVNVVGLHSPEPGFAVLQRWFDPAEWLRLAQEHRVQVSTVVPSMIQMLLQQPLEDFDLSALKYLVSGAAPLALEVVHEIERRIPSMTVREGYGLTESGAVISTNPPHGRRLGSVGKVIPGYEVRIVDDTDQNVPAGEPGEIICLARGVMRGYWKSPELSAEVLRDGWLHTGDIGRFDDDGFLYVVDRKKDLIIRGGFNVFPRDVEDALLEHPAVGAAAVVGRPDDRLGEEVVAYVSLRAGQQATPEELIEFAKARVGRHKYPREVVLLDAIPLTPVGKVDRKAVRALVRA
ncbi:MAG TPA: AMP-binding protein [Candidatus Dormibacteraeota bacterium]